MAEKSQIGLCYLPGHTVQKGASANVRDKHKFKQKFRINY